MTDYPWSYCLVRGRKTKSRKFPPNPGFMCGKCFKRAPKRLRDRRAKLGRKLGHTRNPAKRNRLEDLRGYCIYLMIEELNCQGTDDQMPPAMKEQLREAGFA